MREIIPVRDLDRRMAEAGRIRIGAKKGNRPTKLDTFRFTSQDRTAIEQLAVLYGGTAKPWKDGHGDQWEVITEATEVRVVLPPTALGDGPMYELWSGGGCQRRCDGEVAQVPSAEEMAEVPCICIAKDVMECSVKTRLSVILPDVKFSGVWRLDTSSWNAAVELPGMADTIHMLQERSLNRGLLALERRQSKKGGKTRNFVVPCLRLEDSVDALQQPALAAPPPAESTPEVGAAPALTSGDSPPSPREEVSVPATTQPPEDGEASSGGDRRRKGLARAHATFKDLEWDYEEEVKPALLATYGVSLSKMDPDTLHRFVDALADEEKRANFADHFPAHEIIEEGAP